MSIRKKPSGRFEVRWREAGRRYGRSFDRRGDAEAFDLEIRRRQQLGGVATLDRATTLTDFFAEWWALHVETNLAAHTRRSYEKLWRIHLEPLLGGYRLHELTPRVINRFRAERLRAGVGRPTVRKSLAVLQSILRLAVEEERIDTNPVAKIRKPTALSVRDVDPIPPIVIERIRVTLALRDATLVSVLAYAGLRPGEALALRWSRIGDRSVSVERAIALGEEKSTKTGRSRTVRMLSPLAEDLAAWRATCGHPGARDLLFPRRGGEPWHAGDWDNWRKRIYRPAAEHAGLSGSRPYDLRGSFVSLLIFEGHTVIEVARQAGHSPEMCLRHYARVFAEYDPSARVGAEGQIRSARAALAADASGRSQDAGRANGAVDPPGRGEDAIITPAAGEQLTLPGAD